MRPFVPWNSNWGKRAGYMKVLIKLFGYLFGIGAVFAFLVAGGV